MENIQKGDFVTCVAKHGNSKSKLTIGKSYEVKRAMKHFTRQETVQFSIFDDEGNRRYFPARTKMFERADGTDLFNDSHFNIMRHFANEIEQLTMCSLQADISEDDIEKDKSAKIKEYLIKLMKAKK
jgi:hypothetical protein